MLRRPPNFLVTTPESLYLLLTAERSRALLTGVQTVIVDEIHAVAGNKRGSHLALTLERLHHVADAPPQRIGLSATQRPIEDVARLLVGAVPTGRTPTAAACEVVDVGHRRELDLALELPDDELGAVASAEQMGEILDRIAEHVAATGPRWSSSTPGGWPSARPRAGRAARRGQVAAHHGSLSRDRRQRVEARLRAGDLRRWWPRRRSSSGSTSARSSWCARSARRGASPRSCSGWAVQPHPFGHAEGDPVPHEPGRAGRMRRPPPGDPGRAPGRHRPARGPARHRRPAGRGGVRRRGLVRGRALRPGPPGRPLRAPVREDSTPWSAWSPTAS